jgi:hypothetical protein
MEPRRDRLEPSRRSRYPSPLTRRSGTRKPLLAAVVVIAAALATSFLWKNVPRDKASGPAPELIFESAGAVVRLSSLHGKPVLLSFIDTREHTTDRADNPDMSRRLLVFIESMRNQYAARGLTVVLVDGSPPVGMETLDRLINFRFDHGLVQTPMISGDSGRRAMQDFGVRSLPTTFLIGRQGQIHTRWEGLVLPSTLAGAVEEEAPLTDGVAVHR